MTTKLKCLLLDDELPGLAFLRTICEEIPNVEVVRAFNDPGKFLADVDSLDYDLCIMDIEMPGSNGLEIARSLKKPVIFTTAYKEYAADAFDLNAIDYVRKPIVKQRLEEAIKKALQKMSSANSSGSHPFNTSKGKSVITFDSMVYFSTSEIDKRDKTLWLNTGEICVIKNISFEQLLEILPKDIFCRISKREIVSTNFVKHFTHSKVVLSLNPDKEIELTLSSNYRKFFMDRF